MAKRKTVFAFAALATSVFSAHAVDWSAYKNSTYTVPADTTNEVTQADFSAFNNISKVVFENEESAILVTTSNFPYSVSFQGPGTLIMQEKAIFGGGSDWIVRRTLGTGDENGFVKFVFKNGMDSHNGTTANLYYFLDKNLGNKYVATNATMYMDGPVTNISFCGGGRRSLNGRIDLGKNINCVLGQSIGGNDANTSNFFGVVRQRGGQVLCNGYYLGFKGSSTVAYLLEDGSLAVRNGDSRWYAYSRYLHFRQNGGCFDLPCWQRPKSENNEYTLPFDFIYGGSAVATNMFENSTPMFLGPMNIVVMGDAKVNAGWLRSYANEGGAYVHNVCVNGGELTMNTRPDCVNVWYSFNGGTLRSTDSAPTMFGKNDRHNNPVWVRIYENGGCIYNDNGANSDNQYLYLPHLKEPVGNVVWNVEISDELRGKVWQSPPSVVITDSTGAGSNAVAVVDYDFDSGKVTNITVACRGENYSDAAGAVTANLRYKAGDALLSTPLVCNVGPCAGGDVTLAGGKTIYAGGITNTYHGATIIDMDRDGVYDHPASAVESAYHSVVIKPREPLFSNCTNVVVKSGCFYYDSDSAGVQLTTYFPNCARLELYGGHLSKWAYSGRDLVVGGECWLCNHHLGYLSSLTVPADGTLTVDAACLTNGVTPKLKYGTVNFTSGAKIAVRNWEVVPDDDAYHTLLDLSEATAVNGTPEVEMPDGLSGKAQIRWNSSTRQLMMRRSRGFLMILL